MYILVRQLAVLDINMIIHNKEGKLLRVRIEGGSLSIFPFATKLKQVDGQ